MFFFLSFLFVFSFFPQSIGTSTFFPALVSFSVEWREIKHLNCKFLRSFLYSWWLYCNMICDHLEVLSTWACMCVGSVPTDQGQSLLNPGSMVHLQVCAHAGHTSVPLLSVRSELHLALCPFRGGFSFIGWLMRGTSMHGKGCDCAP